MWSDCHSATEDIFAKRLRNKSGTYNVAGLAVCFLFHSIERLPSELVVADDAGKTIHVEDLIHGSASCTFPNYVFSTPSTAAWKKKKGFDKNTPRSTSVLLKPKWRRQQVHNTSGNRTTTPAVITPVLLPHYPSKMTSTATPILCKIGMVGIFH